MNATPISSAVPLDPLEIQQSFTFPDATGYDEPSVACKIMSQDDRPSTAASYGVIGDFIGRIDKPPVVRHLWIEVFRLVLGEHRKVVDARPSDCLNLAARQGAPIFVTNTLMEKAGQPVSDLPELLDRMTRTIA